MKISTIQKTIRREKPLAFPRSTLAFCAEAREALYEEFLQIARLVVAGK